MTHASVFSGIGGPEVAASMLGWENLFHCEINPFGKKVLDYWYPNAESYDDITRTDFTKWRGRVDVFTGGFPCQPFSYAGRRRGAEDDRYLWPSMYRAIDEIQPTWVVAENVAGILTMVEQGEVSKVASPASLFAEINDVRGQYQLRETFTLQRICTDLEGHGYAVQPILIPACAVGAPHRRDRVFIVARRRDAPDSRSNGGQTEDLRRESRGRTSDGKDVEQPQSVFDSGSGTSTDTDSMGRREGRCEESGRQNDGHEAQVFGVAEGCSSGGTTPHPDSHRGREVDEYVQSELADGAKPLSNGGQRNVADTSDSRRPIRGSGEGGRQYGGGRSSEYTCRRWIEMSNDPSRTTTDERGGIGETERTSDGYEVGSRWQNFPSVSPVHRGNDGLPFDVDRLTISFGKWRTEALKAYGNAIVPQVMYEIFRAIDIVENGERKLSEQRE